MRKPYYNNYYDVYGSTKDGASYHIGSFTNNKKDAVTEAKRIFKEYPNFEKITVTRDSEGYCASDHEYTTILTLERKGDK